MGTWIVGAIVFTIVMLAGYKIFKDQKNGNGCGGGCGGCRNCPNSGCDEAPKT